MLGEIGIFGHTKLTGRGDGGQISEKNPTWIALLMVLSADYEHILGMEGAKTASGGRDRGYSISYHGKHRRSCIRGGK